jgi:hypothetical protein
MLSIVGKPLIPTIYELVAVHTGDKDLAIRAVKSRLGKVPVRYLGDETIMKKLGYRDEYKEELRMTTAQVDTLYEGFNFTDTNKKAAVVIIRRTQMFKNPIREAQEIGKREIAADILGNPVAPKSNRQRKYPGPKTTIELARLEAVKRWVVDITKGVKKYYRVPIPEDKLNTVKQIYNEEMTAKKFFYTQAAQALNMDPESIEDTIFKKLENKVVLILFPIEGTNEIIEREPFSYTEFELSRNALKPGKILNREYIEPELVIRRYTSAPYKKGTITYMPEPTLTPIVPQYHLTKLDLDDPLTYDIPVEKKVGKKIASQAEYDKEQKEQEIKSNKMRKSTKVVGSNIISNDKQKMMKKDEPKSKKDEEIEELRKELNKRFDSEHAELRRDLEEWKPTPVDYKNYGEYLEGLNDFNNSVIKQIASLTERQKRLYEEKESQIISSWAKEEEEEDIISKKEFQEIKTKQSRPTKSKHYVEKLQKEIPKPVSEKYEVRTEETVKRNKKNNKKVNLLAETSYRGEKMKK